MEHRNADMRRDALRRTREFHRQNRDNVQAQGRGGIPHERKSANPSNPLSGLLSGLFSDGKPDADKIIIIALILLLAREGTDLTLLMALGYILM